MPEGQHVSEDLGNAPLQEVDPVPKQVRQGNRRRSPCKGSKVIAVIGQGAAVVEVDGSNPRGGAPIAPLSIWVDDLPGLDAPRAFESFDQEDDVFPPVVFAYGLASCFNQFALLSVLRRRWPGVVWVGATRANERGCDEEAHVGQRMTTGNDTWKRDVERETAGWVSAGTWANHRDVSAIQEGRLSRKRATGERNTGCSPGDGIESAHPEVVGGGTCRAAASLGTRSGPTHGGQPWFRPLRVRDCRSATIPTDKTEMRPLG